MALVRTIKEATKERQTLHEETICLASTFTDEKGRRYIQLDTYGTKSRKMPNKVSQAIQFDEGSARQLKRLIEDVYPDLK